MLKKIIIIISVCITIAALIIAYFFLHNFKNYKNNSTIKAVPTDVSFLVQIDKPEKLISIITDKTNYKNDLIKFPWYKKFNEALCSIDSSSRYDNKLSNILKNKKLTISFHKEGQSKLLPIFLFQLDNKAEENNMINYIENESRNIWTISKRKYNSNYIYSIIDKEYNLKLFIAFDNGLLIASPSSLLVENSLRRLNTEFSLLSDKTFNKIYKTAGNNCDLNLFINFKNTPETLKPLFNRDFSKQLSLFNKIGDWSEFDITFNHKQININGFVYPKTDDNSLKILFDGMNPSSSNIIETIPSNVSLFMSFNIDTGDKLHKNLFNYLKKNQQHNIYTQEIAKLTSPIATQEYENIVFDILDEEFALVYTQNSSSNPEEGKFLIIETNSKSKTLKALNKLNNGKEYKPIYNYKLDDETTFPIYKSNNLKAFQYIFNQFVFDAPITYFTFVDNYLIFSSTIKSSKSIIYANELKKTIYNSKYYQEFSKNFAYRENFFLFCDISQLGSISSDVSSFDIFNPNKEQQEALSHFYGIGIQTTNANNLLYSNISIEHLPVREKEPRTIWQSGLDSTIFSKPALVENHYTKEKEILVQDKSNILYLIANNGKIIWQKKLNAPILSEIFQIDYYRNNKLQYLFNTKDKIYLLDRNGNHVEKYPVNLSNEASNGIALFDYDKNRNYRIFVACKNKKTYCFDKSGKIIKGWKAPASEGIVNKPIQHFRINNKDYIVFSDDKRNYILNRKGEIRVTLKPDFIRNSNSLFFTYDNSGLITTDTKGNARTINLDNGNVNEIRLINEEDTHYFTVQNITKETGNELILLTKEELSVYSQKGDEIFSTDIEGNILPIADIYHFSSTNKKIGLYDQENNKIYLINNDGSIYKNFPLKGQSRFSIGFLKSNNNHFNLIVGGDNSYLYNYRVE